MKRRQENSERNNLMFMYFAILGFRQKEIANEFHLSPGYVKEIIGKVRRGIAS